MKLICTYNICSFGWSQVGREFEIRSFCDKLEELPNKCAIFERKKNPQYFQFLYVINEKFYPSILQILWPTRLLGSLEYQA